MIGHVAYTDGSPCPTLVLDARDPAAQGADLLETLVAARARLVAGGDAHVLKFALISPATTPGLDLDYRFVQCLPGDPDRYDFGGSCGHSLLGSAIVAGELRWIDLLAPRRQVGVNVVNTDDIVICEVEDVAWPRADFAAHFLRKGVTRLGDVLLTGEPVNVVESLGVRCPVSLACVGNPYAFVDAATVGIGSKADLFSGGQALFERLEALRAAVAARLGLPRGGAFPKLAAIGQFQPGRLVARAMSVPTWHPGLGLTGTVCLGATCAIEGSIPHELARRAGTGAGIVAIETPSGVTRVGARVTGATLDDRLERTTVEGKRARLVKRVEFDCPGARSRRLVRRGARTAARAVANGPAIRVLASTGSMSPYLAVAGWAGPSSADDTAMGRSPRSSPSRGKPGA